MKIFYSFLVEKDCLVVVFLLVFVDFKKNYLLSRAFFALMFRCWPFVRLSVNNCPLKFVGRIFNLICLFWIFLFSTFLFNGIDFELFAFEFVSLALLWALLELRLGVAVLLLEDGVSDDEIKLLFSVTEWWLVNVDGFFLPLTGNVLLFERECFFVEG